MFYLPHSELMREPRLLRPRRHPYGMVRLNRSHPFANLLESAIVAGTPYDLVDESPLVKSNNIRYPVTRVGRGFQTNGVNSSWVQGRSFALNNDDTTLLCHFQFTGTVPTQYGDVCGHNYESGTGEESGIGLSANSGANAFFYWGNVRGYTSTGVNLYAADTTAEHLMATQRTATQRLVYLNGVLWKTSSDTKDNITTPARLTVLDSNQGEWTCHNIIVYSAWIWRRSFTAGEHAMLYRDIYSLVSPI